MKGSIIILYFFISMSLGDKQNVLYYDDNDVVYFVYYFDKPAGCVPEAKDNGREVVCSQGAIVPADYKNMNVIRTFFNVNNCFYVPPGNTEGYWYRDNYCGLNPLDNTYFFSRCYNSLATWNLTRYSDSQCTQLVSADTRPFSGACNVISENNSSQSITCAQNAYVPPTTTTAFSYTYYNWTTTPSSASYISVSTMFLLINLLLFA